MKPQPEDCYYELPQKAGNIISYIDEMLLHNPTWHKHVGFNVIELPLDIVKNEAALSFVDKCSPIARIGLLRVNPDTCYDWHTDGYRLSCVNLLINENHNSHTLFGNDVDPENYEFIELEYKPRTYYLFNNAVEHTVINMDGPRYLVSLYFKKEMEFHKLRDLLISTVDQHDWDDFWNNGSL